MKRVTGRNEKGELLVNGKLVCAGELYEVASLLEKYENMEEKGKLFKLPCALNDRVHTFYSYDIEWCFENGMNIEEILEKVCKEKRVYAFDIRYDGVWIVVNGDWLRPDIRIPIEEFGKTVFFTKQEEIEALERMKGE